MENNTISPAPKEQKISTPQAIVVAGVLIMVAILVSRGPSTSSTEAKTLSEQVGVSKSALTACIAETDVNTLNDNIVASIDKAMSHIPADDGRGTPYTIVIGSNGIKTDIRGALSYENVKQIVDDVKNGKSTNPYKGDVVVSEPNDHVMGSPQATVTMIEYSDYECPFCKQFHPTLERIVAESNGSVRWIYRHYPLHQHSFEKLVAANCVAKLGNNDAFWKYSDLLFGLLKTSNDSVSEQL